MILEFLPDGSPDCPLIRLYAFTPSEANELRGIFLSLSDGSREEASLHELAFVQPQGGVSLRLRCTGKDVGVNQAGDDRFECDLTTEGWLEMADKTEPLCVASIGESYQWLNEDGDVSLLLSRTGRW